ncbi:MAG: LLM class flavin-dependent oxidoreductase [Acidimicrobiia bacterium]|nr:LLM class flavin-dependent oxidoreductase [Acidimicrobiia bacterium]
MDHDRYSARLRLGLWLHTSHTDDHFPVRFSQTTVALVEEAENAGFSSVWSGESFAFGALSPLIVLSGLIDHTSMDLGALVLLPAWHPLRLARDAASVDQVSGGRLRLGVGVGRPAIQEMFGVDPTTAGAWCEEAIAALRSLWNGGTGIRGRVLAVEGRAQPRPFRSGGPPLWIGGSIKRSARRAAEIGDGYYASTTYTFDQVRTQAERYLAVAHQLERVPAIAANRFTVVAPTLEEARATAITHFGPSLHRYALHGSFGEEWADRVRRDSVNFLEELADELWLVGNPEQVARAIGRYRRIGVEEIHARVSSEGMPSELARQTVRLLGSEVMPTLTEITETAEAATLTRSIDTQGGL